jgi:hypothetical protein
MVFPLLEEGQESTRIRENIVQHEYYNLSTSKNDVYCKQDGL